MLRVLYRILSLPAVVGGWLSAAQAKLRLDDWTRYSTLAKQGEVFAGYAKILNAEPDQR